MSRISTFLAMGALTLIATRAQAALVIAWSPTSNVTCAHHICTATSSDAVLGMSKLKSLIQAGNVKVVSGSVAGDIEVNAAVSWLGANTLTLDSYHSIVFEAPFTVAGTGGLVLTTNDGGADGLLHFTQNGNVTFWSTANALTIDGHAYTLVSDIATLAADVAATPGGYYALANSYNAQPDGTYAHAPVATALTGTFEGLGNTISNLTVSDPSFGDSVGLFATIYPTGTVADIGLLNANVSSTASTAGALAGGNYGTIRHAFATGFVSAVSGGGGLAGGNGGTVEFSHASDAVASGNSAGGIVGSNTGVIMQSYATGSVQGDEAGGLVGINSGTQISQCYATGPVSGGTVGGLIGANNTGTVTQTYETGSVTGSDAGGLIGDNGGVHTATITYSYWDTTTTGMTGKINGTGNRRNNAGITPLNSKTLKSALPAGFDPAAWGQNAAINGGFPYLLAIPPS